MKVGMTYIQNFNNGDKLYFRPTGNTNIGVKGILYRDFIKRLNGKNPKKYTVTDIDSDLWSEIKEIPINIENQLKERI